MEDHTEPEVPNEDQRAEPCRAVPSDTEPLMKRDPTKPDDAPRQLRFTSSAAKFNNDLEKDTSYYYEEPVGGRVRVYVVDSGLNFNLYVSI